MNFVEPIRDLEVIQKIKDKIREQGAYRDLLLFTLGINTGLRISDILKIRWYQLLKRDLSVLKPGAVVTIKEMKTKKTREFVINYSIYEAIRKYKDSIKNFDHKQFVFKSRKRNMSICRERAWQILKEYTKDIEGLNGNIGTHTLRKTFGYHLYVTKKIRIEYIQKMLNHSSPAITLAYIGITKEIINNICEELNL